jgi:hypothetical protein
MPNHDFTHLRLTPAQARELHAVLNAEAVASVMRRSARAASVAAWDRAFRVARGETIEPKAEPGPEWDRAFRAVRDDW